MMGRGKSGRALKPTSNLPMVEEDKYTQTEVDRTPCSVGFMDTTGMEGLTHLLEERIKRADAFILIYSVWSRSSFDRIRRLHTQISELKGETPSPILIFGNQSRDHNDTFKSSQVEVSREEGSCLARDLECNFVEDSGNRRISVQKAMSDLLRCLRVQREDPCKDFGSTENESKA